MGDHEHCIVHSNKRSADNCFEVGRDSIRRFGKILVCVRGKRLKKKVTLGVTEASWNRDERDRSKTRVRSPAVESGLASIL